MANDTNDAGKSTDIPVVPVAVAPVAVPVVAAPATATVVTADPITLHEFCQRLSSTDKRVELIGAFHHTETAAGTVKDTEDAFKARFADFVNKPV